jgi:selenium donor protein
VKNDRVLRAQGDDAGVYLVRDDLALVQTVDFFTPIVNDSEAFGAIAAANSLSDIYALGATPITALNIAAFPEKGEPGLEVLSQILAGGYRKTAEAGVAIIGGHTVDDKEPKYGLAVTGVAHPNDLFCSDGARPGDVLVLTKPLGTGILATALKGEMEPDGTEALLIRVCSALNDSAARVARQVAAGAVTDVTGFGLLLHLRDLLKASQAGAELWFDALPILPGVDECLGMGLIPAGTYANRDYVLPHVDVDAEVTDDQVLLAGDAQTSGGLLFTVAADRAEEAVAALVEAGTFAAAIIGRITENAGRIRLRPGR